jgi:hypothetical protein
MSLAGGKMLYELTEKMLGSSELLQYSRRWTWRIIQLLNQWDHFAFRTFVKCPSEAVFAMRQRTYN